MLLVRVRGVVHPIDTDLAATAGGPGGRPGRLAAKAAAAAAWRGPTRRYDILKEGTIATLIVLILIFGLSGLLSSPDVPQLTIANWAKVMPNDFLARPGSS